MHEYTEADTLVSVLASYGWHFALSYLPKADSEEVWEAYWTAFKSHYVRPADQIQWIEEIRETVDAFLRQYE